MSENLLAMKRYGNRQKHLNQNPLQQRLLHKFHQQIINLIQQTQVNRVLDVGCAEGFVLKHLHQALPNTTMMGGDFSFEALTWGHEQLNHDLPMTNLDIHRLPFPDNHFPLVLCLEVLEHLPDSSLALRELSRVSSDYLLVSVPHEPFFCLANFIRLKHVMAFGNDPEHLHNYTEHSFKRLVSREIELAWYGRSFPWQIALGRKRQLGIRN